MKQINQINIGDTFATVQSIKNTAIARLTDKHSEPITWTKIADLSCGGAIGQSTFGKMIHTFSAGELVQLGTSF